MELKSNTFTLQPGQRWAGNAFLALAEDWRQWREASPVGLYWRVEDAAGPPWNERDLMPLLSHWALPEETRRGAMVISHLDKAPFTSAARYGAAHAFAGFHRRGHRARAGVGLYALRDLEGLEAVLHAPEGWSLAGSLSDRMARGSLAQLHLEGPATLTGREQVRVLLRARGEDLATLGVPGDVEVEPRYPLQVKQVSAYLDERFRGERSGYFAACGRRQPTPAGFRRWQDATRKRMFKWLRDAVIGPAPLRPRLMERQVGPHCVRDKVLLQTEPDMWLPTYVVYPRRATAGGKMPAIIFAHGSGPGKLHFAPDETEAMQDPTLIGEWPSPYQFAHQLGCLVVLPDLRGWGEWSEANHGQRSGRAQAAGYNVGAMAVWDHLRVIDYLRARSDVDAGCITCMGSSGGGWMTLFVAGFDPRCAGGIISSSVTTQAAMPDQYFHRVLGMDGAELHPSVNQPMATAAIACMAAPRPLWVMDGLWDRGALPVLPHSDAEARAAWDRWHRGANAGRDEIARAYALAGASDRLKLSWFDGGHLAGFTLANIRAWLKEHWSDRFTHA